MLSLFLCANKTVYIIERSDIMKLVLKIAAGIAIGFVLYELITFGMAYAILS